MFLISLDLDASLVIPLVVVVIGLFMIIFYLLYRYERAGKKKKLFKVRDSERQLDFECPRCGAQVDAKTPKCVECSAEFEEEIFSCPVCGIAVSSNDDYCPECGEIFVVTEREYECPVCHVPLDKHHKECLKCGAKFWSPVKRSTDYYTKDEEIKRKKIDPSLIEVVGDEED